MDKMRFYDLANIEHFDTDEYQIVNKSGRSFAVAESSKGTKCWKAMKKQDDKLRLN